MDDSAIKSPPSVALVHVESNAFMKNNFDAAGKPKPVFYETMHVYEIRPRKDKRGVDLISDALPFGRLWYGEPDAVSNAIG